MREPRPVPARAFRALLVSSALLPLLVSPAEAARWKDPTDAEKRTVEDAAHGLVGAVYLEKTQLSESGTFQVYVRAKVLSKAGFDIGTVEGLDSNAYDIAGRTVRPSGQVTELASKDIRTVTSVKAAGVSLEHKTFTMPALEPGCFIEYTYREPGFLGGGESFHTEILFQDKYPILRQELRTPSPFPFTSTTRSQNGVRFQFREDHRQYIYETHDVEALRREAWGWPLSERSAAVIFVYVLPGVSGDNVETYWKDATKKILVPIVKQMMVRPGKVTDRLKTIEGSREAEPVARLKNLYRWQQSNVKNRRALRSGEVEPKGGWKKNEDAGDVLSHGDGTPAQLVMTFASLLRADGWKYRIVFAPDRETRFFRKEIPSVFQFGAWLVAVTDPKDPAGTIYLSFEHPLLAFGSIPWNHLGTDCYSVDIDEETGTVLQIPQATPDANARRRTWSLKVSEDGDVHAERDTKWSGLPAFEMRADLYRRGKDGWEKAAREEYQRMTPPGELESASFEGAEDPDQALVGKLRVVRKGMATPLPGGRIEFAPLALMNQSNPFTQETRNEPFLFDYPYLNEDVLTIVLPDGFVLDALPAPVEQRSAVGRYTARAEKQPDNSVSITRTFELKRYSANAELYPAYRYLFEKTVQGDAGFSLVLKKTAPAKKGT